MRLLQAVQEFLKDSGYNGTRSWKHRAESVIAQIPDAPDHQVGIAPFERLYEAYHLEMEEAHRLLSEAGFSASACTTKEKILSNPNDLLEYLGVDPQEFSKPLSSSDRTTLAWKPLEALAGKHLTGVMVLRTHIFVESFELGFPFSTIKLKDILQAVKVTKE